MRHSPRSSPLIPLHPASHLPSSFTNICTNLGSTSLLPWSSTRAWLPLWTLVLLTFIIQLLWTILTHWHRRSPLILHTPSEIPPRPPPNKISFHWCAKNYIPNWPLLKPNLRLRSCEFSCLCHCSQEFSSLRYKLTDPVSDLLSCLNQNPRLCHLQAKLTFNHPPMSFVQQ